MNTTSTHKDINIWYEYFNQPKKAVRSPHLSILKSDSLEMQKKSGAVLSPDKEVKTSIYRALLTDLLKDTQLQEEHRLQLLSKVQNLPIPPELKRIFSINLTAIRQHLVLLENQIKNG